MTDPAEAVQELERNGYVVIPGRMHDRDLIAARDELSRLLAAVGWGSGFDGTRTKRVWALLATSRCMDRAALDPVVLDVVEQAIGPGTQFSLTPPRSTPVKALRSCTTSRAPTPCPAIETS